MQKLVFVFGSLSLGLIALSGCNNLASPESTVGSAYQALQSGDLQDFAATLSGSALARYGNAEGMKALQQRLAGFQLEIGKATELSSAPNDQGGWATAYSVLVSGNQPGNHAELLMKLDVLCESQSGPICGGTTPTANPMTLDCQTHLTNFCAIDSIQ